MLRGEEIDEEPHERSRYELYAGACNRVTGSQASSLTRPTGILPVAANASQQTAGWKPAGRDRLEAYPPSATPSKQTISFFNKNLVMEWSSSDKTLSAGKARRVRAGSANGASRTAVRHRHAIAWAKPEKRRLRVNQYGHERAVADQVNVNYDVYKIETEITKGGSRVENGARWGAATWMGKPRGRMSGRERVKGFYVEKRDRLTRKVRWEQLGDDLIYAENELDRAVVAPDQIRTVLRTFRDRLFTEIFPGRNVVPKTLIFAKDDSHADDIVKIAREEFGVGNDFIQKITYRTTGAKPADLIRRFRNSVMPRIAVTVDMIATGTDIKPLEIVMFMRSVKSRSFFEQMKGRGVRVISDTDFQSVTPDAKTKTHFVIVDAVGVCERDTTDSRPLEQKPTVPPEKLFEHVAIGAREPELLSSLAGRVIRLEKRIEPAVRAEVERLSGGKTLSNIARDLLDAIYPDNVEQVSNLLPETEKRKAQENLANEAVKVLATNPDLRNKILDIQRAADQTIDTVSQDKLLFAGADAKTTEAARDTIKSFRDYIEKNKAEIEALQILYSRPFKKRLTEESLRELEAKLKPEFGPQPVPKLWDAFEKNGSYGSVSRSSQTLRFTDLVSLVRTAIEPTTPLEPFEEHVHQRFAAWLDEKRIAGITFTPDQLAWLEKMRDYISASGSVDREHLEADNVLGPIYKAFGEKLWPLMDELNLTLAA